MKTHTPKSGYPSNSSAAVLPRALRSALLLGVLASAGCGSSSDGPRVTPVTGAIDGHCSGVDPIVVNEASCAPPSTGGGTTAPEPAAPILYNSEGDDDDCKYHVKFSMTAADINQDLTFTVTTTKLADGTPAGGVNVQIESYLADNDLHPVPNDNTMTTETPAGSGVDKVGPVKFDAYGRWVVRFHLREDCDDTMEDSPHGHVAFYVNVPTPAE